MTLEVEAKAKEPAPESVIPALDGTVVVAKVVATYYMVGSGAVITAALQDEDDSTIIATSIIIKKFKGMEQVSKLAGEMISNPGKGYDFQSIGFVVSVMAASLHISGISLSANTALAGSSYGAAKTLDLPGRMAMQTRRDEHVDFDKRLLRWMGAEEAQPRFNSYEDATDEYRAVQAAYLMWQSGNLSPEAFRAELENIYQRKIVGGIPKGVIIPNNQQQMELQHQQELETQAAAAKQAAAANQGKGDGTGGAGHANDMPAKAD